MGEISQTREEISQSMDISAKLERKSAKVSIYQPNKRGNQPKHGYISQTREEISQSMDISAKLERKSAKVWGISAKLGRKSAKVWLYQPN